MIFFHFTGDGVFIVPFLFDIIGKDSGIFYKNMKNQHKKF